MGFMFDAFVSCRELQGVEGFGVFPVLFILYAWICICMYVRIYVFMQVRWQVDSQVDMWVIRQVGMLGYVLVVHMHINEENKAGARKRDLLSLGYIALCPTFFRLRLCINDLSENIPSNVFLRCKAILRRGKPTMILFCLRSRLLVPCILMTAGAFYISR